MTTSRQERARAVAVVILLLAVILGVGLHPLFLLLAVVGLAVLLLW